MFGAFLSLCGKIYRSSDHAQCRNLLGQLHGELHLRMSGLFQNIAFCILDIRSMESEGTQVGPYDFQLIANLELVVQAANSQTVFVAAFHFGNDLPLPDVAGMLGILTGLAVVETCGVNPMET